MRYAHACTWCAREALELHYSPISMEITVVLKMSISGGGGGGLPKNDSRLLTATISIIFLILYQL